MNVLLHGRPRHFRTVTFEAERNVIHLIDQRLLPHVFSLVALRDYRATAQAIQDMVVRGAPAIAATAAYGLAQGARAFRGSSLRRFAEHVRRVYETLKNARPTAVDPAAAMDAVLVKMSAGETVSEQQALALAAAEDFAHASVAQCEAIGRHGASLIRSGLNVLTHCNAGWLACVDVGTATAPLYAAHARGRRFHVWCDETRPRCQGAALTAWELAQQGIAHQVIADNAAGLLMAQRRVGLVLVGSDRVVARTGEVVNKIGTYPLAVLAKRHGVPFYVAVPLSTLDWELASGRDVPLEERGEDEVLGAWGVVEASKVKRPRSRMGRSRGRDRRPVYVRIANPSSGALNPAFDLTPPELVTGIITPVGLFKPGDLWRHRGQLGGPSLRV